MKICTVLQGLAYFLSVNTHIHTLSLFLSSLSLSYTYIHIYMHIIKLPTLKNTHALSLSFYIYIYIYIYISCIYMYILLLLLLLLLLLNYEMILDNCLSVGFEVTFQFCYIKSIILFPGIESFSFFSLWTFKWSHDIFEVQKLLIALKWLHVSNEAKPALKLMAFFRTFFSFKSGKKEFCLHWSYIIHRGTNRILDSPAVKAKNSFNPMKI